jgi:raffinose/stachyose/melibiose transport system permease protein
MRTIRRKTSIPAHLFLLLVGLFSVGPIILLTVNTLKPAEDFLVNPFGLPSRITLQNIVSSWTEGKYSQAYLNSLLVGLVTIVLVCIGSGMGAYALAKMKFKGKDFVLLFLFLALSVPMGLFLVPLFFLWQSFQLMDSLFGLIIIYSAIFMPFNVFLLRSFFLGIPLEISESAKIDGCTEIGVMRHIILPISRPAFLTVALIVGLWTWNEFFFANAFIQSEELKTVATRYLSFVGSFTSDWSKIFAAGFISIFPIVVIYLLLQRQFIEGITEGSIKG